MGNKSCILCFHIKIIIIVIVLALVLIAAIYFIWKKKRAEKFIEKKVYPPAAQFKIIFDGEPDDEETDNPKIYELDELQL